MITLKKIAFIYFAIFSYSAVAGGQPQNQLPKDENWKYALGIGAISSPEYLGAKDRKTTALPYFSIRYKSIFSVDPLRGIDYKFYSNQHFAFSIGAAYDFGREEDDADILDGLGDVDSSLQPRLSMAFKHNAFELGLDYLTDAGGNGHDGSIGELMFGYTLVINKQIILKPGLGAIYGDDDYMQSYFGVTSEQASSSTTGLSQYQAESGLYALNSNLTAIYNINPHLSLVGFAKYSKLKNDAEDSPLVEKKSQTSAGLVLSYTF